MRLVLLGPPGAGKGTQAEIILNKFEKICHISTGQLLRKAVKEESEIGKKTQSFMKQGKLVPDNIVIEILVDKLKQNEVEDDFLLDGFPRTKAQAVGLDKELKPLNKPIELVIYFKASDKVSVQRLSGRRVCKDCGTNYHILNRQPNESGVCDKCTGKLIQREDDKPEVIKERLKVYKNQIAPLLAYYNEQNIIEEVNGNNEASEVFLEIKKILKEKGMLDNDLYKNR